MSEPVLTPQGDQLWTETNGTLHRTDGPAVIHADGTEEWWRYGVRVEVDQPQITEGRLF